MNAIAMRCGECKVRATFQGPKQHPESKDVLLWWACPACGGGIAVHLTADEWDAVPKRCNSKNEVRS
jgi:hypothetical protein